MLSTTQINAWFGSDTIIGPVWLDTKYHKVEGIVVERDKGWMAYDIRKPNPRCLCKGLKTMIEAASLAMQMIDLENRVNHEK